MNPVSPTSVLGWGCLCSLSPFALIPWAHCERAQCCPSCWPCLGLFLGVSPVDRCGCACLPPGVPCSGPFGVLAWPRWSCLGFRSFPVSRPVTMQPINNLQPPHSGVWSSDDCVCRERRLRELCSLGLLVFANRMAGVISREGIILAVCS